MAFKHPLSRQVHGRAAGQIAMKSSIRPSVNQELVASDAVALVVTCTYRQILHIVSSPDFPGWLAPLVFSPMHILDFLSYLLTITGSWIISGLLLGLYNPTNLSQGLRSSALTWLFAMPLAASQMVLTTAVDNSALVGEEGWVERLPLPAEGAGEPFVTAAIFLGVMSIWRCYYLTYIYQWSLVDDRTAQEFNGSLVAVGALSLLGLLLLSGLDLLNKTELIP